MDFDSQMEKLSIKDRNEHMLNTGIFSDCTLCVGESDEEQRKFSVHKHILASASPVFQRMFFGDLPYNPSNITDIQPDVFYQLLKYVYCQEFDITTFEAAYNLYFASKKYLLMQLNQLCLELIEKKLDAENVLHALEFAVSTEETNLHAKCEEVIRAKTPDILASSNLHYCNFTSLITILEQNQLNIKSELDIFEALEKYAKNRSFFHDDSATKNISNLKLMEKSEESEKTKDCDLVAALPDPKGEEADIFKKLIKRVRFLTMSDAEFLRGPAFSQLLTPVESLAILDCIKNPNNIGKRLPKGFNNSRQPRYSVASTPANKRPLLCNNCGKNTYCQYCR